MPSSHWYQLNEIMELIIFTQPKSILDIGVGFGKYGFLSREFLELLDGREKIRDWRRTIDGIEIFEEYINPLQKMVYNHVYIGNAFDILPTLEKKYDLILLIDIIEHFTYQNGEKLIQMCREIAKNIIISTPKFFVPQPVMFGNPHEVHKSFFKKKHFRQIPGKIFIPNMFSLIVYIGDRAGFIKSILKRKRFQWDLPARFGLLKFFHRNIADEFMKFLGGKDSSSKYKGEQNV